VIISGGSAFFPQVIDKYRKDEGRESVQGCFPDAHDDMFHEKLSITDVITPALSEKIAAVTENIVRLVQFCDN
jgi:hypothetical protein